MPISLGNSGSILPYLRYNAHADVWIAAGDDGPRSVQIYGQPIIFDPENGVSGWLLLDVGTREWMPVPATGPRPKAPDPNAKFTMSLLCYAPKTLGREVHEMCATTLAYRDFATRLYNECEPHFGKGKVPVVIVTGSTPVRKGRGMSRELEFRVVDWVPRPQALRDALLLRDGPSGKQEDLGPEDDDTGSAWPADNAYARAKSRHERRLEQVVTSGKPPVGADIDDDIPF